MIGLSLGGDKIRFCVVDSTGRILEEGSTESSEAALRRLLSSMPPAAIAVEYQADAVHLLATIQDLGHVIFFSGPAPEPVVGALRPKVESVLKHSSGVTGAPAIVAWRHVARECDAVALRLMFNVDRRGRIADAWYFVGPISCSADLGALPGLVCSQASGASAADQASRLQQLFRLGDASLTACAERAAA
jgi:hypothetical protein